MSPPPKIVAIDGEPVTGRLHRLTEEALGAKARGDEEAAQEAFAERDSLANLMAGESTQRSTQWHAIEDQLKWNYRLLDFDEAQYRSAEVQARIRRLEQRKLEIEGKA